MIIELRLLFPVVAQVQPAWVRSLNKCDLPTATPPLEFFLTRDRVIHVSKVLDPHDAVRMIPFRKSSYISVSVLEQTATNVVCDPDVQRRAMFIAENVHPIIVVSHASQKESEMFRSAQHDRRGN